MKSNFKDRVIKRRKEINLSQLDLANALGYTPQAISKFEKSNSSFPITIVPKLANALDITIDSLLGERQSSFHADKPYQEFDEKTLINNLRSLRKKHDLTIGAAAKKLDVSPRSLAAYEKGETVMPISCFEHALSTYEVSAEEMLYLRQEEPIAKTSEPLASPKYYFWTKKVIAVLSSIVVILAIVIPISIHYVSKVKEDITSSSTLDSSSALVVTEADFPSDYSIEPVGFSVASPLGDGDYSFKIVLPDGYSLHEGITIQ
jgi:transcriptional regulator with XRE-family HTH domain